MLSMSYEIHQKSLKDHKKLGLRRIDLKLWLSKKHTRTHTLHMNGPQFYAFSSQFNPHTGTRWTQYELQNTHTY